MTTEKKKKSRKGPTAAEVEAMAPELKIIVSRERTPAILCAGAYWVSFSQGKARPALSPSFVNVYKMTVDSGSNVVTALAKPGASFDEAMRLFTDFSKALFLSLVKEAE